MDIAVQTKRKTPHKFYTCYTRNYKTSQATLLWLLLCVCLICPAMRFFCLQQAPKTNPQKRPDLKWSVYFFLHTEILEIHCWLVVMVFSPCTRLYMSGHTLATTSAKKSTCFDFFLYFFSLPWPSSAKLFNFGAGLIHVRLRRMPAKCLRHLIFLANPTQIKRDNNTWSSVTTANLSCAHVWWETRIQTLKMQRKWRQEIEGERKREKNRLV